MSDKIEAILPLRISGEHYEENIRRTLLLLASLSTFWSCNNFLRITFVMRADDIKEARREIGSWPGLDLRFVDENEVITDITNYPLRGWLKQQLLKLAVAKIVEAPFYLTLDPDIVCCRKFSDVDLIINGRALTQWEQKHWHPSWWRVSARALNISTPSEFDVGFSVTPNILRRDTVIGLIEYLNMIGAKQFHEYLASVLLSDQETWTEYSLYSTYLEMNKVSMFNHHIGWQELSRMHLTGRGNIWDSGQVAAWNPEWDFSPEGSGYFIVCQSRSNVDVSYIIEKIGKYLRADFIKRIQL